MRPPSRRRCRRIGRIEGRKTCGLDRMRSAGAEQAAALDDLTRQRAGRQVRATQALIRAHVARHGLVRRTRREQLDLGNR